MHDFSITILRTKESSRSFKTVNGKEACTTWKCVLRDGPQEYASFKTVNGKEACTTHIRYFGGRRNATNFELLESDYKNSLFDCVL